MGFFITIFSFLITVIVHAVNPKLDDVDCAGVFMLAFAITSILLYVILENKRRNDLIEAQEHVRLQQEKARLQLIKDQQRFDETIDDFKSQGFKIVYANKNTGTITYKANDGITRSIQVFKGYNSKFR